jgi:signal transduction histidine kinase
MGSTVPLTPNQVQILIAEDSPTQAERLRYTLEEAGYRVSTATNGLNAYNQARHARPTLVISDIVMPEMDGYQLCQQVKSDPLLRDIPVILVTTLSDPQDVIRGLECGADNFVVKPYDEKYLLSRIEFVLANYSMRQPDQDGSGVPIHFNGQRHVINADRRQILNLLVSTYEAAIQRNRELTLTREALRAANLSLEATNKELEAFSYSVSHDLRAPLRTIEGFSECLLEDHATSLDGAGRDLLDRMQKASGRMKQLIEDLLNLSRVSRGDMKREAVNITGLAETVVADLRTQYPARQVEMKIAPAMVAQGDARLLRVALENLLGNAWKFTAKQPLASIEFGNSVENGQSVFFIRDNGAGFDMSQAEKLFGTFQRLHSSEEFPGTGIGLATVQRIINRHRGRIWAHGAPGQGATFFFSL